MKYRGKYRKKDEDYLKQLVIAALPLRPSNISSTQLSQSLGINSRDVRHLIQLARMDGVPICSTAGKGYWITDDAAELSETIMNMKSTLKTLQGTIDTLELARNIILRSNAHDF